MTATTFKLVPVEPTEDMVIAGFESTPCAGFTDIDEMDKYDAMSGCQQAAHRARLCYAAMLAAAPGPSGRVDEIRYDAVFWSIAKAVKIQGADIAISVSQFEEALQGKGFGVAHVAAPAPSELADALMSVLIDLGSCSVFEIDACDSEELAEAKAAARAAITKVAA